MNQGNFFLCSNSLTLFGSLFENESSIKWNKKGNICKVVRIGNGEIKVMQWMVRPIGGGGSTSLVCVPDWF